jgi:hypothetical protein
MGPAWNIQPKDPEWHETNQIVQSWDFEVDTVWKGNPGPVTSIVTGPVECPITFKRDRSYIVLAYRVGDAWATGSCEFPVPYHEHEAEILRELGAPRTEYVRMRPGEEGKTTRRWAIVTALCGVVAGYLIGAKRRASLSRESANVATNVR